MRIHTMSEAEWLDAFGDNLASLLNECGMSQRELAEISGLSESSISYYINKQKMPGVKAVINIAHALKIDIDDLIDFYCDVY